MNRLWVLYPIVGAICLALGVWAWVGVLTESYSWTTTFPAVISGLFFVTGVAVSIGVDTLLLARRSPHRLRLVELILLIALVVVLGVTIWLGFYDEASWATLFLWPAIILLAIACTVLIAIGNARPAEPVATSPWEQAGAQPPQPPTA